MGTKVEIGGNNYGQINNAGHNNNILNNNQTYGNDMDEVLSLLQTMKEQINSPDISDDDKELLEASLESVESEVKSEKPRFAVIKNAYIYLSTFIMSLPAQLEKFNGLKENIVKAKTLINQIFGKNIIN